MNVMRKPFVRLRRAALAWTSVGAVLVSVNCGLARETVSSSDPMVKSMLDAMPNKERRAMGFTPIDSSAQIRVEWAHPRLDRLLRVRSRNYDAMLHVYGKTSRTIAFRHTDGRYQWLGEQETFEGPRQYRSFDGMSREAIAITYERVPMSGAPINTVAIDYRGEEPDLMAPKHLSLDMVRPWLKRWGYD